MVENELVGAILATYVIGGVGLALLIAGRLIVHGLERGLDWAARALRGTR